MRRSRLIAVGTVALALVVGGVSLFASLDSDSGAHCSGLGGVVVWKVHDRPAEVSEEKGARLVGAATIADSIRHDIIGPCDAKARDQVLAAVVNMMVILLIGLALAWFVARRSRTTDPESTSVASPPSA